MCFLWICVGRGGGKHAKALQESRVSRTCCRWKSVLSLETLGQWSLMIRWATFFARSTKSVYSMWTRQWAWLWSSKGLDCSASTFSCPNWGQLLDKLQGHLNKQQYKRRSGSSSAWKRNGAGQREGKCHLRNVSEQTQKDRVTEVTVTWWPTFQINTVPGY